MKGKRLLLVEDNEKILRGNQRLLEWEGYEVDAARTLEQAEQCFEARRPDAVILDIMLPDEDGLEIVRKLRAIPDTKKVPVMMVTAKTTEIDKVKGLDIGADDYITKPFGVIELISRVKALLRRSMNTEEEKFLSAGDIFLDGEKHMVYVNDEPCELTFKEYELLKLLIQNQGIVMSRDVIMERIWGINFEGESRTLDVHIKTLRQKLKSAGALIKTVRNVGYIIE